MGRYRVSSLLFAMAVLALGILPLLADDTNTPAAPPVPVDDFSPMQFGVTMLVLMVVVVVSVFLLGIGLAVGIALCALAGALTAFGILSSSVAIGFIRRSPVSGVRALILQLGALIGVPCGIAAAWLVSWLAHSQWSITARLLVGGISGLVCGIMVSLLVNFIWTRVAAWIIELYERRHRPPGVIDT